MQYKQIRERLNTLGIKLDKQNRFVDKDGNVYFALGAKTLIDIKDKTNHVAMSSVFDVSMETVNDRRTVVFIMDDGDYIRLSSIPPEEAADIELDEVPVTLSALNDAFLKLYPRVREQLWYDELRERIMVDSEMFGMNQGIVPISDEVMFTYYDDIERQFINKGFVGSSLPTPTIREQALTFQAYQNRRNTFREWMEAQVWDGKPRLRSWFIDLVGATAPALATSVDDADDEREYIEGVTVAWFMGAVARQYDETKVEIVPVLISGQGIGKGNAIRYTAGLDMWYIDTSVDLKHIDRFLDSVRGRVVVELSESSQISGSNSEILKAFISKSSDQYRKPYSHHEETFPRHFSLIASSNVDTLFTDMTGNRRFFPFICVPERATRDLYTYDTPEGRYEVEQLWAEALVMFNNGGQWYINDRVADLAKVMQDYSTQEMPGVEQIEEALDLHYPKIGQRVSKAEIMQTVFNILPCTHYDQEYENAYRAWTASILNTKTWRKMASKARIGSRITKGFERINPPGMSVATSRLRMVSRKSAPPVKIDGDDTSPRAWFYKVTHGRKIRSFDEFPILMTDAFRDTLVREGYITQVGVRGDTPVYKALYGCDTPDEVWSARTVPPTGSVSIDDL